MAIEQYKSWKGYCLLLIINIPKN